MKTKIILFNICVLSSMIVLAQTPNEKEMVMKPIKQLFEAMQKGDSAMLRKAFTKQVTMARVGKDKTGKPVIHYESSLDGFAKSIGTPHTEAYNELIWDEKIEIDGNLAQVWASFAFYLGKKFNHCGVDAFQLVKGEDGEWKIFHLADTGQKEGCNIPAKISDQFK
jgi:hypothetical protein